MMSVGKVRKRIKIDIVATGAINSGCASYERRRLWSAARIAALSDIAETGRVKER